MTREPSEPGADGPRAEEPRARHRGQNLRRAPVIAIVAGVVLIALLTTGTVLFTAAHPVPSAAPIAAGCTGPATTLTVLSSPDTAATLTSFAASFSASARDSRGHCVGVRVLSMDAGPVRAALVNGWTTADGPLPDVWSPSDSMALTLLRSRAAAFGRAVPLAAGATPSLASSPLVMAMPRSMAAALGWPKARIGWSTLFALARSRAQWSAYGHPEWGSFTLGKTNPQSSDDGLAATVAAYYGAVGRTSGLTADAVSGAAPRAYVAGVEQSVARYADSSAGLAADWYRAAAAGDSAYASAAVLPENLVADYDEGHPAGAAAGPPPREPLEAIYPVEGSFVADHPYAVLDEPWVTAAHRAVAAAFLADLRSPAAQKRWRAAHFRAPSGRAWPATAAVTGIRPSTPVARLQTPSAPVLDEVLSGWSQLRKTANVLNLIDTSASMNDRLKGSSATKLHAATQAAASALGLFTDEDRTGLWSFSEGRGGGRDYSPVVPVGAMGDVVHGTDRRTAISRALRALRASGGTGLYDSIAAAYRSVKASSRPDGLNAVVVLTDGRNDRTGGTSLAQLLALVSGQDGPPVRIITLAFGPDADTAVLQRIAAATGGSAYVAPTTADIPAAYSAALSAF